MRGAILTTAILFAAITNAQVTVFNSPDVATNAATRDAWLAAAGITSPNFTEDFESYSIGTVLQSTPLIGGATITDSNASPIISVQSSSAFFGSSVPFGQGLALREGRTYNIVFAVPTTYVALYDIDQGGSDFRVFLSDSTFFDVLNLDSTASSGSSGEFLGFVSTGVAITEIRFNASGGDGEVGIDDLQYGAVPEPATLTLLGLGAVAVLRRKRRK